MNIELGVSAVSSVCILGKGKRQRVSITLSPGAIVFLLSQLSHSAPNTIPGLVVFTDCIDAASKPDTNSRK